MSKMMVFLLAMLALAAPAASQTKLDVKDLLAKYGECVLVKDYLQEQIAAQAQRIAELEKQLAEKK